MNGLKYIRSEVIREKAEEFAEQEQLECKKYWLRI